MQGYNPNWSGLLSAGAQRNQALGNLGMALGQGIAQKRDEAEAQKLQQQRSSDIFGALESGNPSQVAQVSLKYPEISQSLRESFKFTNDATEDNFKSTNFNIIADPSNAEGYLTERVNFLESMGVDASQPKSRLDMYRDNPEKFIETTRGLTAATYPDDYKKYQELQSKKSNQKPTANIQDFQYYEELSKTNPEQAEQFALQVGIKQKPANEVKPTTAMQNFDKWDSMQEGDAKTAFGRSIGITPKENPKEARLKAQEVDLLSSKVQSANDTITTIDEILSDNALGDMVGLPSAFPTVPGSDVANLEAKVEQFRNQLTLENLDKMSGVLTDRDIQVLASAASGLETSMSPSAFKSQLNKIKGILNRGSKQNQAKLKSKGVDIRTSPGEPQGDQGQSYSEGTVIRNPSTGETMILQGGQWVANNG